MRPPVFALPPGPLAAGSFKDLALAPEDASDRILYNINTGMLFFDPDGSGGAAAVQFATLSNHAAGLTNAEYFQASSGAELKKIYDTLTAKFVLQRERTEITAFFAAAAASLVVLAAALSLAWFNRIL